MRWSHPYRKVRKAFPAQGTVVQRITETNEVKEHKKDACNERAVSKSMT
jgi:hypothetical protein